MLGRHGMAVQRVCTAGAPAARPFPPVNACCGPLLPPPPPRPPPLGRPARGRALPRLPGRLCGRGPGRGLRLHALQLLRRVALTAPAVHAAPAAAAHAAVHGQRAAATLVLYGPAAALSRAQAARPRLLPRRPFAAWGWGRCRRCRPFAASYRRAPRVLWRPGRGGMAGGAGTGRAWRPSQLTGWKGIAAWLAVRVGAAHVRLAACVLYNVPLGVGGCLHGRGLQRVPPPPLRRQVHWQLASPLLGAPPPERMVSRRRSIGGWFGRRRGWRRAGRGWEGVFRRHLLPVSPAARLGLARAGQASRCHWPARAARHAQTSMRRRSAVPPRAAHAGRPACQTTRERRPPPATPPPPPWRPARPGQPLPAPLGRRRPAWRVGPGPGRGCC